MNCTNCSCELRRNTDVFGSDEHPICLLCWLDPAPVVADDLSGKGDIIWTPSDVDVTVPFHVATCCFCDSPLTVEVFEWETGTRKPTEGGMWIRYDCDRTCRGSDNMDDGTRARIEEWAIAHIRIMHSVPSSQDMIPGIKCPALEKYREIALPRGGAI
jgi:hypothetical protein